MSREILAALGGGLVSAIFYISVKTGTPGSILLAYLSPLPLFLAGFGAGWTGAAVACAVAAAAVAAGTTFAAAAMFLALVAVPATVVARQALLSRPGVAGTPEWYPPGLLLGWLTGYGATVLCLAALYLSGASGGLEATASRFLNDTVGRLAETPTDPRVILMLDTLARYLPGMMGAVWLIVTALNATLAQGLLARFGWNRRPSPAFTALELPGWMIWALIVAALATLIPGQIGILGRNALIVTAVPFLFLGLAVLHALLRRMTARTFILVVLYLLLILFGWPAIVIVGIGILEQWVELRRRYGGPPNDQEEE